MLLKTVIKCFAKNQRLKRICAELSLDHQILKDIVEKALTAGRRRELVADVHQEYSVSERRACRIVGIHWSVQHCQTKLRDDQPLVKALQRLSETQPRWGFGKM